jgi:hypothetical protein
MGLHHGESPFHKTKSTEFGGISFSMKCPGDTSLTEAGTLKKLIVFLHSSLWEFKEKICLSGKYFYLDKKFVAAQRTLQM